LRGLGPLAVALGIVLAAACTSTRTITPAARSETSSPLSTTTLDTAAAPATTPATADPGTLAQTRQEPDARDPKLLAGAQALWQAIVADDPAPAMPLFFPRSAYLQVKAIADPAHDWQARLVAAYQQDVHSLHLSLGPNPATFAGITVPMDQARWVNPGEEYNRIGYWRVYNSALQYVVDGRLRSFTIASLISWRGEWYVVHLRFIR